MVGACSGRLRSSLGGICSCCRPPPTATTGRPHHRRDRLSPATAFSPEMLGHAEISTLPVNFSCRRCARCCKGDGLASQKGLIRKRRRRLWRRSIDRPPPIPCTLLPGPAAARCEHTCPHLHRLIWEFEKKMFEPFFQPKKYLYFPLHLHLQRASAAPSSTSCGLWALRLGQ